MASSIKEVDGVSFVLRFSPSTGNAMNAMVGDKYARGTGGGISWYREQMQKRSETSCKPG
jgi:hypothetical protein